MIASCYYNSCCFQTVNAQKFSHVIIKLKCSRISALRQSWDIGKERLLTFLLPGKRPYPRMTLDKCSLNQNLEREK